MREYKREKTRKTKKTDENNEINANLETFSNSQQKMCRVRFFSLTTYATEKQIQKVVTDHVRSIRALCYIYHDKDESEPHHHVLIRTHSAWTSVQIARWFSDLKDEKREKVNTFCEVAHDMDSLVRYILHDTAEAREAGKHLYSREDIKDFGMCDLAERKDSYDSSYEILMRVLSGMNPRELVRYYGRDFLYHINAYYDCAERISDYEGYKESRIRARMEAPEPRKPRLDEDQLKIVDSMEGF